MKKIIFISRRKKDSIFIQFNKRLFNNVKVLVCNGNEAAEVIKSESPNLVFFELPEPVNGSRDMMYMLRDMNSNIRLRVSIIKYNAAFSNFSDSFKNLFNNNSHKRKREAFVGR